MDAGESAASAEENQVREIANDAQIDAQIFTPFLRKQPPLFQYDRRPAILQEFRPENSSRPSQRPSETSRRPHLRPLRLTRSRRETAEEVIINEADRMTPQAEVMWLDGLRVKKAPGQDGRRVHHEQPPQAD
jgi:hypothetical protein